MKRVLIIDNEPFIQEVAKICLEMIANWEVITASSGKEGIIRAIAEQPDAILLDVMMPEMDGLTTFAQLHNNAATQSIPVILLTAKIQTSAQHHYAQLGIKATIGKPFEPLELAHQIAAALNWNL
ncbi:response regulator [Phormidesmis priestleyi ULC007]|uniref:Response regulator n=1 Tax=Phormidesmis priestleyi ULC007 TaxID=1920490 RepID=A0A2T1DNG7_9CYAN|nr:response regulator [Phormidesmis priestleyi]PSB22038.1 response regulator [Phormidesmis priestleyi ULC007]PZO54994.1 MAG: response regulator [Phormidesmis priestleyi]